MVWFSVVFGFGSLGFGVFLTVCDSFLTKTTS